MRTPSRSFRRRLGIGVLAAAVTASACVSPANAVPGFTFERLAGDNRYGTAADIATDTFATADTVVLASGAQRNFPDALTGNYLAGAVQGPILLTNPTTLPAETRAALDALDAENVVIVGGTSAVSAGVAAELERLGYDVDRLGGDDRYETAELIAMEVGENGTSATVGEDADGARTAILGFGQNFPDILAAGPLSYAEQFPIAITRANSLPAETRNVLEDLNIERVIITGGTEVVSAAVENEVKGIVDTVDRLQGGQGGEPNNRFTTAIAIADFAYGELGFDDSHINLARGDDFADALAGGPHAGEDRSPIVLSFPNTLNASTEAYLEELCPTLENGHIFGGTVAIGATVKADAEGAASSCDRPQPATLVAISGNDTDNDNVLSAGDSVVLTFDRDVVVSSSVTLRDDDGDGDTTVLTDDVDQQQDETNTSFTGSGTRVITGTLREDPVRQLEGEILPTALDGFVTEDNGLDAEIGDVEPFDFGEPSSSTIAVTPDTSETRTANINPDATPEDDRAYSVSGLVANEVYRITLVICANVRGSGAGATFLAEADSSSSTGFSVATATPTADITRVNDQPRTDASTAQGFQSPTTTFTASGPTATFTVDGDAGDCVVPVVHFDSTTPNAAEGGGSPRLEVAGPAGGYGAPAEDFDTGGSTEFLDAPMSGNSAAVTEPVPGQDVQRGDPFNVRVEGSNIQSVRVNGPCVVEGAVTDTDAAPGVQGRARLRDDAPVGSCTLTFRITFANGATMEREVLIDVVPEDSATVVQPTAGQDVQTSDRFTVEIVGTNVAGVSIRGSCVEDGALTDSDPSPQRFLGSAVASGPAGPCTLTFTTTFTDGESETDSVTIDVVAEDSATVTQPTEGQDVQRGDTFTATITGSNLRSVSVSGACLSPTPQQVGSSSTSGTSTISGPVRTSEGAALGPCTLTFTTTFTDGESESDTRTIDITPEDTATVTQPAEGQDVQRGDTFTATITGSNLRSVSVSGACLNPNPQQVGTTSDSGTSTISGPVRTSEGAALGPCTLTFTTTFTDGETESDTRTIDIVQEDTAEVIEPEEGEEVQQGDTFTATIRGTNLAAVTVFGQCLDPERQTVEDTDTSTATISGPVQTADDATVGPCTLTFTTTFTDGETESDTRTIEIVPEDTATVTDPDPGQVVQQGGTFTATITGTNLVSVRVDGECLPAPQTLTSDSPTTTITGPIQTDDAPSVPVCQLTFRTTFADNESDTDTVTIVIAPDVPLLLETEPNDSPETADELSSSQPNNVVATGSSGDRDYYRVHIAAPGELRAETTGTCDSGSLVLGLPDTVLELFAADGTTRLAENDDIDGLSGNRCSLIVQNLAAGTYFIAVSTYRDPDQDVPVPAYTYGLEVDVT